MAVPTNLKHKPVIAVDNYDDDAEVLSIGIAQWDETQNVISAKVFRRADNGNWSPQSEELPLHRVIDLASLILAAISTTTTNKSLPITDLSEKVVNEGELKKISTYYQANKIELDARIKELKRIISNF